MVEQIARDCPPFRWRMTGWLAASPLGMPEAGAELRASLFNGMTSLVTSAVLIFALAVLLAARHPTPAMLVWPMLDGACSVLRLALVGIILRHRRRHPAEAAPGGVLPDLYMLSGLLWCASLGYGTGVCLAFGGGAVSTLGGVIAMATMAAQCARVPGAPRIVALQFLLIGLPLCAGACLTPDRMMAWIVAVAPAYLVAMISINRQLHRDFVELIAARQECRRQALHCPLTGLPNRRMFDRALAGLVAAPTADGTPDAYVLCLDLDGFKAVNDAAGHPVGDLLLQLVARRLLPLVPETGLLARIGGDEFAVLARLAVPEAATRLARTLIASLQAPFRLPGDDVVRIGCSVGIAGTSGGTAAEAVFAAADAALYAAKRSGRNRFRWHGAAEDQLAGRTRSQTMALLRPVRAEPPAVPAPLNLAR